MSIDLSREPDGVATVLMNRPAKRNAFTLDMYRDFGRIMGELDADDAVRCVVLRGAGGAFCAGSDIAGFGDDRDGAEQAADYAAFTLSMTDRLKFLRHPTLACIEGVCVGGGLELAALCDIRIAGRSSRYGIPVNRIGLTVDHQELADLIAVIGATHALEILLEGHVFGAEEAMSKGLLSRVVDDEHVVAQAYAAAARIAAAAPLVNRWHKRFASQLRAGRPLTDAERREAYACFGTEDYRRGREAFARKQVPEFTGR
ncbi:enoyl-CoA hydratase/isomerase family protein [Achromobacter sp. UMC46]|uniref:enoyl-CoA hydratase/isomerase family protein n=1 Tax=Achromobacter sp. UMC46 TaxID=1862319 RepID=UPI0016024888|nr:enoyl-CoA hydratase-related protein [Achromobacter sp. UMC46]MBB1592776.1 enoyl-CoA hydratase [Achromobacter sp. UMC46]